MNLAFTARQSCTTGGITAAWNLNASRFPRPVTTTTTSIARLLCSANNAFARHRGEHIQLKNSDGSTVKLNRTYLHAPITMPKKGSVEHFSPTTHESIPSLYLLRPKADTTPYVGGVSRPLAPSLAAARRYPHAATPVAPPDISDDPPPR